MQPANDAFYFPPVAEPQQPAISEQQHTSIAPDVDDDDTLAAQLSEILFGGASGEEEVEAPMSGAFVNAMGSFAVGSATPSFDADWNPAAPLEFPPKHTQQSTAPNTMSSQTTTAPAKASTAHFLVLCSGMSLKRESVANQEMAYTILDGLNLPYDKLDGAEPVNKDRRNELFDISGIRGQYPQFFIVHQGVTTYFGDWEYFQYANDEGILGSSLMQMQDTSSQDASTSSSLPPGRSPDLDALDPVPPLSPKMEGGDSTGDDGAFGAVRRNSKVNILGMHQTSSGTAAKEQSPPRVSKIVAPKMYMNKRDGRMNNFVGHQSASSLSVPSDVAHQARNDLNRNFAGHQSASSLSVPRFFANKAELQSKGDYAPSPTRQMSRKSAPSSFSKSESALAYKPVTIPQKEYTQESLADFGTGENSEADRRPPVPRRPSKLSIPDVFGGNASSSSLTGPKQQPRRWSKKVSAPDTLGGQDSQGSLDLTMLEKSDHAPKSPHRGSRSNSITGKSAQNAEIASGVAKVEAEKAVDQESPRRASGRLFVPATFRQRAEVQANPGCENNDVPVVEETERDTPYSGSPRRDSRRPSMSSSFGSQMKNDDSAAEMIASCSASCSSIDVQSFRGVDNVAKHGSPRRSSSKLVIPNTFGGAAASVHGKKAAPRRSSKKLVIPATFAAAHDPKQPGGPPPKPPNHVSPRRLSKNIILPEAFPKSSSSESKASPDEEVIPPASIATSEMSDLSLASDVTGLEQDTPAVSSKPLARHERRPSKLNIPGIFGSSASSGMDHLRLPDTKSLQQKDAPAMSSIPFAKHVHRPSNLDTSGIGGDGGAINGVDATATFDTISSEQDAIEVSLTSPVKHERRPSELARSSNQMYVLPTADMNGSERNSPVARSSLFGKPERGPRKLVIPGAFGGSASSAMDASSVSSANLEHEVPAPAASKPVAKHERRPSKLSISGPMGGSIFSENELLPPQDATTLEEEDTSAAVIAQPLIRHERRPSKLAIPGVFGGSASSGMDVMTGSSRSITSPSKARKYIPATVGNAAKHADSPPPPPPLLPDQPAVPGKAVVTLSAKTNDDLPSDEEEIERATTVEHADTEPDANPIMPVAGPSPGPRKKLVIPGAFAKSTEPPRKFGGGVGW
ncbi:hypothetical protein MPSEU_000961500 [Mayamaea pseudoterrestris]|nr:hypothetical protein MPSEU_000961500 [Mayamaea pseudoterrestris]